MVDIFVSIIIAFVPPIAVAVSLGLMLHFCVRAFCGKE